MPRCFASAVLLASLCRPRALRLGDDPRTPGSAIEVELYHVAFGQNRATRDEVVEWAKKNVEQIQTRVRDAINTWPGASGPAVSVTGQAELRPSGTRAGGGEEVFLQLYISSMAAEAMGADLRSEIRKRIAGQVSSFKGAVMQEPTYRSLKGGGAPSGEAAPGPGASLRKARARRDEAASGLGDPHLTNMHGEHFDLYKPGVHALIVVPRRARPEDVLLRVEADAQRLGAACEDLYFQVVNVTGRWSRRDGGLQFSAQGGADCKNWTQFGEVYLKVVRGHTTSGIAYLNFFVKRLGRVSYPVGGLLGEDDHRAAATPGPECGRAGDVDLHAEGPATVSIAEAAVEG